METKAITVRDALIEEAPVVLEIWRAAFQEDELHGAMDDVQRVIFDDHSARMLLAVADGRPIGTLIATFDGWRGNMYRMAVLPEYQRRGIGRALVSVAEQWLHAIGCHKITALVEGNRAGAVGFWSSIGYGHDERMRRYTRTLA